MKKNQNRKKKILRYIFSVLALIIAAAAVFVITQYDLTDPDDLTQYLERKFDKLDVAGMAVTVFDEDEIIYFEGLGYYDTENEKQITKDTVFQIASISKTVTGTAIMQLYEDGLIDIDANINGYLPVDIVNPYYPDSVITPRMLLIHTSSICDYYAVYDGLYTLYSGGGDSPISLEEFVEGYFVQGGQWYYAEENFYDSQPGSYYEYSNCGYALLGYLLESVTGQSFNEYCKENIFEPLGMDSTGWFLSEVDTDNLAIPYDKSGEAYPFYGFPTYPDGCLKTSSADYSIFLMAMMNGGAYNGVSILEDATISQMLSPQVPGLEENQGITWLLQGPEEFKIDCGDLLIPGHSGGDQGVCTIAFYSPETKKGAIVFINNDIKTYQVPTLFQIFRRLATEVIGE